MAVYKHLFFDLDHTIWDFDTNAKDTLQDLYNNGLAEITKAPFQEFYDKYLFHNAHLWARYEKGFIGVEELKWKRMWRTLLDFKIADEGLSKELSATFLEILPTKKVVFPYTFEILEYLTKKNYQLHLITNGFVHTQTMKLKNSGLDKYFIEMITSEVSNSIKPKKEIFDFALQKTNAKLNESLMLGDNQDADIAGALNAGMDVVFVNHTKVALKYKPTYNITHLKELENIL
ncbi:MAG: YjjG family noncanonical pyrimidine nucleotidase [Ferruginibacter sp.]|nr:noncanonical pyrimidine nucleotidase, YjjG family [Ferruginibacter sp.]